MIWFFWALCVFVSFLIAAVAVGSVTGVQASRPRRAVYVVEDAVAFTADHLPDEITATIGFDDVRAVIDAQIAYFGRRGVASGRTFDTVGDELVMVDEDEPLAYVLGQVDDRELGDDVVVAVLAAEAAYRRNIGAVGHRVDGDEVDGDEVDGAPDTRTPDPLR